jgi:hypothetical protein
MGWVTKMYYLGKHVKQLIPVAFAVVSTPVSRRVDVRQLVVKIMAESSSQHDKKHCNDLT